MMPHNSTEYMLQNYLCQEQESCKAHSLWLRGSVLHVNNEPIKIKDTEDCNTFPPPSMMKEHVMEWQKLVLYKPRKKLVQICKISVE